MAAPAVLAGACGGDDQKSATTAVTRTTGDSLPRQTSQSGEIEVGVTPAGLTATDATWDFNISVDSQGAELTEDLAAATVLLVDGSGKEYKALAFEGDPPGGIHREGTLKFDPVSPEPRSVTLKLRGVGGIGERSFSWTMGVVNLGSSPQAAPATP
ncbi:MAG: hypothetical protein ACYC6B_00045 [Thermoleophilia bacterium]